MPGRYLTLNERISIHAGLLLKIYFTCYRLQNNPFKALVSTFKMVRECLSDTDIGARNTARLINGKTYFHLNGPGYPSAAFDRVFNNWISHSLGIQPHSGLRTCYVYITSKCPLSCTHCFEWDSINKLNDPSVEEIITRIQHLMSMGCSHVVFTGGEPVLRLADIIQVLDHFPHDQVEIWINTSGTGLTRARIEQMKQHGLSGIIFSLDHFKEENHDEFRGRMGCYNQVLQSVQDAGDSGLITALSLCATKSFVTKDNLDNYLDLATALRVDYIQLLEAKAEGRYADQQTSLTSSQQSLLEDWYLSCNRPSTTKRYLPTISYPDLTKRHHGCMGGRLYAYLQANGMVSPCPFCKSVSEDLMNLKPDEFPIQLACPQCR